MIYIAQVSTENQPPEGMLNLKVTTVPDTYLFYAPVSPSIVGNDVAIKEVVLSSCDNFGFERPAVTEIIVQQGIN